MVAYLDRMVAYLFTQSWQIAVLVVGVALFSSMLRNRSAHARYLLWLIVLAKCLVPPAVEVPVAVLPPERSVAPEIFLAQGPEVTTAAPSVPIDERPVAITPGGQTASVPLSVRHWLVVTWVSGATFFVSFALIKTAGTVRWLRRKRRALPNDMQRSVQTLVSSSGVRKAPRMWLVEGIGQPFVWGLVRGEIYLPTHFARLEDRQRQRDILGHELSHVLRFDAGINTLQIVAQAVFWFHPFVWWANRKIRQEREKCCDEMAIARFGASVKSYSTAIIDTVAQARESTRPVPSLAVAGSLGHIEERIRAMMTPGRKFYKHPSLVAATATVLLALLIVPTALVLTARAQNDASAETDEKPSKSLHEAAKAGDVAEIKRLIGKGVSVNAAEGENAWTPLLAAATEGHAEVVKVLLASGAEVDVADAHGYTPLYYAIWSDDEETVRTLVSADADVNKGPANARDYPPLIYAIWQAHKGNVEILLDAGADIDTRDETGYTPLYWAGFTSTKEVFDLILTRKDWPDTVYLAACKGELGKVKALIESGTDVNAKDEFGCTPLHWAALADTNEAGDLLVAKGADANARDNMSFTPLMAAHRLGMVAFLISKGADVNARVETHGRTRLHMSCYAGEKGIAELLVAKGANVDARDKGGTTPLRLAAGSGHKDIVELLLKAGADVNTKDNQGRTPLSMAAQRNHPEVVDILVRHGAKQTLHGAAAAGDIDEVKRLISAGGDVNARDENGRTPLHLAANGGQKSLAEFLVTKGADINEKDKVGQTPLHEAAKSGHVDVAKWLIYKGADVNASSEEWESTPLHCAASKGHPEVVTLLVVKGAHLEDRNLNGQTPLHLAAYRDRREVADILLAKGADIEARTKYDDTPLGMALTIDNAHLEMAELLLDEGANIHARKEGTPLLDIAMRKNDPKTVAFLMKRGAPLPPIHLAAFMGDLDIVKKQLEKGVHVDLKDAGGFTPLHCAVCGRHRDVVLFLIDKGADVNAQTMNGRFPLTYSVLALDTEMAELLIAKGASVRLKDVFGQTLLHWAVNRNDVALAKLFIAHGADVNAKAYSNHVEWEGWTPFHVACRNGVTDIVALLLAHGADLNAKTDKGDTPLSLARKNEHADVVALLGKHAAKE